MKPLLAKELPAFTKRFGNFIDAEIRSLEVLSPITMKLVIACQDENRGFDWLTLEFEFNSVSDASLIDSDKLSYIDMVDGISLTNDSQIFSLKINNSTLFINSAIIKYQEGNF